jgi:hypothetical protein
VISSVAAVFGDGWGGHGDHSAVVWGAGGSHGHQGDDYGYSKPAVVSYGNVGHGYQKQEYVSRPVASYSHRPVVYGKVDHGRGYGRPSYHQSHKPAYKPVYKPVYQSYKPSYQRSGYSKGYDVR